MIYRPIIHRDHKSSGRRSFAWTDYRDLLAAAHQQLGKPIVLVWDNLNVHRDRRLREFIDAQDWLTVHYLRPTRRSSTRSRASGRYSGAGARPTPPSPIQPT